MGKSVKSTKKGKPTTFAEKNNAGRKKLKDHSILRAPNAGIASDDQSDLGDLSSGELGNPESVEDLTKIFEELGEALIGLSAEKVGVSTTAIPFLVPAGASSKSAELEKMLGEEKPMLKPAKSTKKGKPTTMAAKNNAGRMKMSKHSRSSVSSAADDLSGDEVDETKSVQDQSAEGRKKANKAGHRFVYADTGELAPSNAVSGKDGERKIITYYAYLKHQRLVCAANGLPAPEGAVKGDKDPLTGAPYITKDSYTRRQKYFRNKDKLVDTSTGELVPKTAKSHKNASKKYLVPYNSYFTLKYARKYLEDGSLAPKGAKPGEYVGEQRVITSGAFTARVAASTLVYAASGEPAPAGSVKSTGPYDDREIISKLAYARRNKLVYADSGEKAPEGSVKGTDPTGRAIITYDNFKHIQYDGKKYKAKPKVALPPAANTTPFLTLGTSSDKATVEIIPDHV